MSQSADGRASKIIGMTGRPIVGAVVAAPPASTTPMGARVSASAMSTTQTKFGLAGLTLRRCSRGWGRSVRDLISRSRLRLARKRPEPAPPLNIRTLSR